MTQRVLFTCLGNICRSPAAEAVFASLARADGVTVVTDSAGTSDWHVGDPPYAPMQAAAKARGYDLSQLRARQFVAADFERFDLLIAMDVKNQRDMENLRPAGNSTPLKLLLEHAPATGVTEVPDPYYTRDFGQALDLIEIAARNLLEAVKRG